MKTAAMLAVLLAASAAAGGEIYGTLSDEGKPVATGTLRLACADATAEAKTDAYGSYSLKTAATGKCTLSVPSAAGAPALAVTVYEKSTRYDLVLGHAGGKTTLSRK